MKYVRSRPWGTRGPWFSNRAGSRRRGHCLASPLAPGDDVVSDPWADTASAWDLALSPNDHAPDGVPVPAIGASQTMTAVCPGHIDESGLREFTRHRREISVSHSHVPAPASERQPASTNPLDAIGTVPPGRKSA